MSETPQSSLRVRARQVGSGGGVNQDDWDVLSSPERRRAKQMGSERARTAFVLGRALLRTALAEALGKNPAEVPLDSSKGRPVLGCDGPAFSVSHAAGLILVVTASTAVGVDVEPADRWPLPPARTWLTNTEHDRLPAPNDDTARLAWIRHWTAKEAVAKALGTGLGTPLTSIEVDGEQARVTGHDPATWALHHLDDWPGHVVTVALPDS